MRFAEAEVFDALGANGDWLGVTVVVPDERLDDVPQVNVSVLDAPLDVPVPLIVAVVSATFVAAVVVVVGGTTLAGVTKERMPPRGVLAPLA